MDVAGLTLSKTELFCRKQDSPLGWSFTNANWHAGMLVFYVLIVNGILAVSPEWVAIIGDVARNIWYYIAILPDELLAAFIVMIDSISDHVRLILGVFALVIVWRTYATKIISRPEHAEINRLPVLSRMLFNILDIFARAITRKHLNNSRFARFLSNQAQAVLVAVDMLALAILLKSIRYLEEPINVALAAGIIWLVVFMMTWGTANFGMYHLKELNAARNRSFATDQGTPLTGSVAANDGITLGASPSYALTANSASGNVVMNADGSFTYTPNANFHGIDNFTYTMTDAATSEPAVQSVTITVKAITLKGTSNGDVVHAQYIEKSIDWIRITLRLTEPFLIFYFALQLVTLLVIGHQVHSMALYLGAALLLWALVDRCKLPRIVEACLAEYPKKRITDSDFRTTVQLWTDLRQDVRRLGLIAFGAFIGFPFLLLLLSSVSLLLDEIQHEQALESVVSYFVSAIGLLAAAQFFFFSWRKRNFDRMEKFVLAMLQKISDNRNTYICMFVSLTIAVIAPIYSDIVDNASWRLADIKGLFGERHKHALQAGIWLVFLSLFAILIALGEKNWQAQCVGSNKSAITPAERNHHLGKLLGHLVTAGSLMLIGVGWLQSQIAN
jgi:hypothetical protein